MTEEMTAGNEQMHPGDFARELEKITEAHLRSFGMNRESLLEEKKYGSFHGTISGLAGCPK